MKRRDNKGRILKDWKSPTKKTKYALVYRFIWRTAICLLVETCGWAGSTSRKSVIVSSLRENHTECKKTFMIVLML